MSVHKHLVGFAFLGLAAAPAWAGRVYGTVIAQGKPLPKAEILVSCSGEDVKGATEDDGSYKLNVVKTGRCTFSLPGFNGKPSAIIFSQPKPAMFDLELTKDASGGYALQIR
jgi:hypothetical protein